MGLSDGRSPRAQYVVGCDGGRSLIRKAVGIDFPGWDATTSSPIAQVEMAEEPGVHSPAFISRFTDMTRQAAAYRDRRVLLAGDAAHVHAPDGGQGLNIGVQDAVNRETEQQLGLAHALTTWFGSPAAA